MFTREDGSQINLRGIYAGQACFLLCNGPALNSAIELMSKYPRVLTIGVNNGPAVYRPTLWTMVDDVKNFVRSIYVDPTIIKFLPSGKRADRLWDNINWREDRLTTSACPSIIYYQRQEGSAEFFDPATFFSSDAFCWGNHTDRCRCGWSRPGQEKKCKSCGCDKWRRDKCTKCGRKRPERVRVCQQCQSTQNWGSRSVMLVQLRIPIVLGCSRLYIVGASFRMGKNYTYAFEQARAPGAVKNNTETYRILNERFSRLRPELAKRNISVWNCTPDSGLESFDRMDLRDALEAETSLIPRRERTEGLYDRKANENAAGATERSVGGIPERLSDIIARVSHGQR